MGLDSYFFIIVLKSPGNWIFLSSNQVLFQLWGQVSSLRQASLSCVGTPWDSSRLDWHHERTAPSRGGLIFKFVNNMETNFFHSSKHIFKWQKLYFDKKPLPGDFNGFSDRDNYMHVLLFLFHVKYHPLAIPLALLVLIDIIFLILLLKVSGRRNIIKYVFRPDPSGITS